MKIKIKTPDRKEYEYDVLMRLKPVGIEVDGKKREIHNGELWLTPIIDGVEHPELEQYFSGHPEKQWDPSYRARRREGKE